MSLHTNTIDWLLAIPNMGFEFDLNGRNYCRNAIGFNLRGRWAPKHSFQPNIVYNLTSIQIYYRNYYHLKQINKRDGVERSKGIFNKLFSCRRTSINHPKRTYYRGLYIEYSDYSLKFSKQGKQGKAATFGFTYGWLTPLYTFRNGYSLDFDMGVNAGACFTNITKFTRDRDDNCYRQIGNNEKKIIPALTEIKVGFVYRFNKYPITKRYRWRYDVDVNYHDRIDSINSARKNYQERKRLTDSLLNKIEKDFNAVYDSVAKINKGLQIKAKVANEIKVANKVKSNNNAEAMKGKAKEDSEDTSVTTNGKTVRKESVARQPEASIKPKNAKKENKQ